MKFKIKKIPVKIFLGVPKKERKNKQQILIDISFEFNTKQAEKSDKIEDTINYFDIYKFIQQFPRNKEFCLLEYLYRELEKAILKEFSEIKELKIKIKKFPFEDGNITILK
jgi:dihydroneopterin aldolase